MPIVSELMRPLSGAGVDRVKKRVGSGLGDPRMPHAASGASARTSPRRRRGRRGGIRTSSATRAAGDDGARVAVQVVGQLANGLGGLAQIAQRGGELVDQRGTRVDQ